MNQNKSIKRSAQDKGIDTFVYVILIIFCFLCIFPFFIVISGSFSDELTLATNGYSIWPAKFSLSAYKTIFSTDQIFNSYKVSIFVTLVGTALSLLFTALTAYPLCVKQLKYRDKINFFIYFTMLFGGGLVPTYILVSKYLHMTNSIWVMIIPALISPWNIFLMRNFFAAIPIELSESARIDGAHDAYILWKIILPVSLPAIATIGLFYGLGYWNQWYSAMLYIDIPELFPLQYLIMKILRNIQFMSQLASMGTVVSAGETIPAISSRLATAIVTIGPVVLAYPFVQKYFTQGLVVGSVKG